MAPGNMLLRVGKIVGYNNLLVIATSAQHLGSNIGLNKIVAPPDAANDTGEKGLVIPMGVDPPSEATNSQRGAKPHPRLRCNGNGGSQSRPRGSRGRKNSPHCRYYCHRPRPSFVSWVEATRVPPQAVSPRQPEERPIDFQPARLRFSRGGTGARRRSTR